MKNLIAPSILSADFGNLARDIEMLNGSCCSLIHLDVMDGVFVPNISFGFPVLESVSAASRKPLDLHLMITAPDRFLERFASLPGLEYITVHYEACTHLHRTVEAIHAFGKKAGVALNPHTNVSLLEDLLPELDLALVMSVNPGFGGQKFIGQTLPKVEKLSRMIASCGSKCLIEVDGGVSESNIAALSRAGVKVFVAGNSVFRSSDPCLTIANMAEL